jgi:hypothetical protein
MESLAIRAYQRSSTVPLLFCAAEVTTQWLRCCSYHHRSPSAIAGCEQSLRRLGGAEGKHSIFRERCKPSNFIPGEIVLILRKRLVGVQFHFFVEEKGNLSLYG